MRLLALMANSIEHRSLIDHPVIDSFLWIKWKLTRKFFNRCIRRNMAFLFCVIWYIYRNFGGYEWNSIRFRDGTHNTTISSFCEEQTFTLQLMQFNWKNNPELLHETKLGYFLFTILCLINLVCIANDIIYEWKTKSMSLLAITMDIYLVGCDAIFYDIFF